MNKQDLQELTESLVTLYTKIKIRSEEEVRSISYLMTNIQLEKI
jgi:hypothetical protein